MDLKDFQQEFILKNLINKECKDHPQNDSLFDHFINNIIEHHDKPVHSLIEMRQNRKTKTKGDLWEIFCKLYLQKIRKYDHVWLLKETPDNILELLKLRKNDVGIDIIACKNNKYSAVQCKFKKPREGLVPGTWIAYNCVNWKELSTFYALCNSTNDNNWENHIVMTNTKYIRHMGNKTKKDKSICYGTFSKMTTFDFITLADKGNQVVNNDDSDNVDTQENDKVNKSDNSDDNLKNDNIKKPIKRRERMNINKMREARLKYFENLSNKTC